MSEIRMQYTELLCYRIRMTRKQKKQKRLRAQRRNHLTTTRWERRVRERWLTMCVAGFIGVLFASWLVRGLGLGFPERPLVLGLAWVFAALGSVFLPVR